MIDALNLEIIIKLLRNIPVQYQDICKRRMRSNSGLVHVENVMIIHDGEMPL